MHWAEMQEPGQYNQSVDIARERGLRWEGARATEFLAPIEVAAPVGNEFGAIDDLRARAAQMGADAVIDVRAGDGALSGVAVRYAR